jgi:hypothetical protein
LPESEPLGKNKPKLTGIGCAVMLLTVAVIFGTAIPIVRWRDPETGLSPPRDAVIVAPFLIGGLFYGMLSVLLWLAGLRVWAKDEMPSPLNRFPGRDS